MEKRITLKSLKLTNFKGARNLTVNFSPTVTSISGRNGSGKTTVFDAFCYVLFGKDSLGRSSFGIKTVGKDGEPLWKLPHEVEATLEVDGQSITILRGWKEKWVKKRGEEDATFQGHDEMRQINGIPLSAAEMKARIEEICDEDTFKLVTNPIFFPSMKPEMQRAFLMDVVGEVSNEEVSKTDDFKDLLAQLTGKNLETFKREIAAKKQRIKKELTEIPPRIEENERNKKEVKPWREELSTAETNMAEVEKQLQDVAARSSADNEARLAVVREIQKAKENLQQARFEVREKDLSAYRTELAKYNEEVVQREFLNLEIDRLTFSLKNVERELGTLRSLRERLIGEWREIKSRRLVINEGAFVCPTCGRPLEMDDIETKTRELQENFNKQQAEALERNKANGMEVREEILLKEKELAALTTKLEESKKLVNAAVPVKPTEPNTAQAEESAASVQKWQAEVQRLEKSLQNLSSSPREDNNQILRLRKNELSVYVDELKSRKRAEENNEEISQRIAELNEEMRNLSQELAELERSEIECEKFSRARSEIIEKRVNEMFSLVKFRLFEKQINGGLNETCIITVDGVPYRDLNSAMRIHAGCDILNTIAKVKGISAPIWIDNAETLNVIPHIDSQLITLHVTDDESLQIK